MLNAGNGGYRWTERCKCGKLVVVKQSFVETDGIVKPRVVKSWFNADGSWWRQTGDEVIDENSASSSAPPPNT